MIFGACLQMVSKNAKLSRITYEPGNGRYLRPVAHGEHAASTYASILGTCPQSCPHLDAGCYAQSGITGGVVRKLDEAVRLFGYSHDQVIEQEAWLIATRKPPLGRVIRVHVSGDARTRWAARQLAEAVRAWNVNGGGPGFTYTHGPTRRDDWGGISVLASVEDVNGIRDARRRGFVPALLVPKHRSPNYFTVAGTRFIPCPAETRNKTCVECRLCLDDSRLRRARVGIAFEAHGQSKARVIANLTQLRFPGIK